MKQSPGVYDKRCIVEQHHQTFESIRQLDTQGDSTEARDLQPCLEYAARDNQASSRRRRFVVNPATRSRTIFPDGEKMVDIGSRWREIEDYLLHGYACYLIVQNGESV